MLSIVPVGKKEEFLQRKGWTMYYHVRYWWQRQTQSSATSGPPDVHHQNDPGEPPPPLKEPGAWQLGVDVVLVLVLLGVLVGIGVRIATRTRPSGAAFHNIVGTGAKSTLHGNARARFNGA